MSTHSKAELEFSDDYQTTNFKGQPCYHLTLGQTKIVRVLHECRYYEASTKAIRKRRKYGALHAYFKSGDRPEIWKEVIIHQLPESPP
jgi:hypothetical protein